MIFKSIKWRLQLWYGLILAVVLAGFGSTAYLLEWNLQLRGLDAQFEWRRDFLLNALHRPPRGPRPGERLRGLPPPPPEDGLPGRPPREFRLPPEASGVFEADAPNNRENFFFIIQGPEGREIARSTNVPSEFADDLAARFSKWHRLQAPAAGGAEGMAYGDRIRERCELLPTGEAILMGCSFGPQLKELHRTAFILAGLGLLILLFGLAGGGWLVGRALRPIGDISATAAKIAAGDLSQRIRAAETESELGQLAAVLNSTFARLEAAFAQQRQFTADAAHELRTPVSVMLTQTQTALQRERGATEYRETVEACQRAAQRMRRLMESLLELARLEAGQEPLKRLRFDLSRTAWECVELVRPLAAERGIKIDCELPPVEGLGDAERLSLVITNLLANAVQYNRPNGEIHIRTKLQGSLMLLAVSDIGRGISREDLPHVFERFYRADPSRSSGQTGLGLAISKAIVEAHGGTIEVVSQPGEGTTFTVALPAT